MKKRILFLATVLSIALSSTAGAVEYQIIDSPSASEIADYAKTLPDTWSTTTTYVVEPGANGDINEYGVVDDYILEEALAEVNYIRYIAGINPVELDDTLTMYAQAGAYVNYLNNVQVHYPEQPEGLSDEVFALGSEGTRGNIYILPKTPQAAIDPYMKDSGTTNITSLGHRRWILNPSMAYIGFGQAGTSNVAYARDRSGSDVDSDIAVIWPATNMPVDYFGDIYPWSFSVGTDLYGDVTVTLTKDDGTVWNFDDSTKDTSGNYFNVNTDNYGQSCCVIFRPESPNIESGDQFQVEIYMDGNLLADYTVSFFDVDNVELPAHSFTDVVAGTYYEDAVIWAVNNGVTSGTSDTTFSPDVTCTRGQVVTFLWRAMGEPTPASSENPFTDVASDDYCYNAVLWAVEQGITAGTSATEFSPDSTCTTAQVLTFLYRANGEPGATGAGEYYADAVNWATTNGLATSVDPDSQSPRSDIVTYLYRNAGSPET